MIISCFIDTVGILGFVNTEQVIEVVEGVSADVEVGLIHSELSDFERIASFPVSTVDGSAKGTTVIITLNQ